MNVIETKISEIKIIEPQVFADSRGFFYESFQAKRYQELLGIQETFVQDNYSRSQKGVLRGLHYQCQLPQGKLISVLSGTIFDVAVDIRVNSPTYGSWVSVILSSEQVQQLWIPKGFAHGFCVLSPTADVLYKCTDYYYPEYELSIDCLDPNLAIDWPIDHDDVLRSTKDQQALALASIERHKLPQYQ